MTSSLLLRMPLRAAWIACGLVALLTAPTFGQATGRGAEDCPSIDGRYHDLSTDGQASLFRILGGDGGESDAVVSLWISRGVLTVRRRGSRLFLEKGAGFTCGVGQFVVLMRSDSSRIHLPPLIDQTKVVHYRIAMEEDRSLVVTEKIQTTVKPYGLGLSGPEQIGSRYRFLVAR